MTNNTKAFTRRSFLSLGAIAIGSTVAFVSSPILASAAVGPRLPPGNWLNPYSVSFNGSRTISEFSTLYFRVELRIGVYNSSQWVWIRVTTINGSNYNMGDRTKLTTPYGIVSGLPYGTGDNWSVDSQRCSAAISIGWPTSTISVTYEGAASGSYASKTVYIYPGGSVQ